MNQLFIISGVLIFHLSVVAGEFKYPVSEIPDSLKHGMYAVIREDNVEFDILSVNKSVKKVHRVVTILNEKAKAYETHIMIKTRKFLSLGELFMML